MQRLFPRSIELLYCFGTILTLTENTQLTQVLIFKHFFSSSYLCTPEVDKRKKAVSNTLQKVLFNDILMPVKLAVC